MKGQLLKFITSKGAKYWLLHGVAVPATGFAVNVLLTLGWNAVTKMMKQNKKAKKEKETTK